MIRSSLTKSPLPPGPASPGPQPPLLESSFQLGLVSTPNSVVNSILSDKLDDFRKLVQQMDKTQLCGYLNEYFLLPEKTPLSPKQSMDYIFFAFKLVWLVKEPNKYLEIVLTKCSEEIPDTRCQCNFDDLHPKTRMPPNQNTAKKLAKNLSLLLNAGLNARALKDIVFHPHLFCPHNDTLGREVIKFANTLSYVEEDFISDKGYANLLGYFAYFGNRDVLELLLENGLEPHDGDTLGIMGFAILGNQIEVLKFMIQWIQNNEKLSDTEKKEKIQVLVNGQPTFHLYGEQYCKGLSKIMPSGSKIPKVRSQKDATLSESLLHFAAKMKNLPIVQFLVEQGASLTATDKLSPSGTAPEETALGAATRLLSETHEITQFLKQQALKVEHSQSYKEKNGDPATRPSKSQKRQ